MVRRSTEDLPKSKSGHTPMQVALDAAGIAGRILLERFQTSKEIVAEFSPAVFKEPLQSVFEEIQTILEAVDIGVILQPLAERLEQLRNELEEGLKRTETAFNGMLAAVPV